MPCGDATIDQCHCEARGCCWGGDDPFTSTLMERGKTPPCYFLYGGKHGQAAEEFFEAPVGETYNLRLSGVPAADAGAVRLKIMPGTSKACGQPNEERDAACLVDGACPIHAPAADSNGGIVVSGLKFAEEGKYVVCMNDDVVKFGEIDNKFFSVYLGRITVFKNFADVAGDCP